MLVDRECVFDVLNGEREYQIEKWGPTPEKGLHTPTEFLVYMQDYLTEAFNQATRPSDLDESVLDTIRKITAMGVACMEQWGAPSRAITDPARLLPASPIELRAEDEDLNVALPLLPDEPPEEIYPEWVELAAKEASECDEYCPSDCHVREPIMKAIYDAYQRGFTEGDKDDQGLGEFEERY
jgi:hypothetical protein